LLLLRTSLADVFSLVLFAFKESLSCCSSVMMSDLEIELLVQGTELSLAYYRTMLEISRLHRERVADRCDKPVLATTESSLLDRSMVDGIPDNNISVQPDENAIDRPFLCEVCDGMFKFKSTLNRHRRTVHTSNRFNCVTCDKTFTRLYVARRHGLNCVERGIRKEDEGSFGEKLDYAGRRIKNLRSSKIRRYRQ
jgi:hypothetical protein